MGEAVFGGAAREQLYPAAERRHFCMEPLQIVPCTVHLDTHTRETTVSYSTFQTNGAVVISQVYLQSEVWSCVIGLNPRAPVGDWAGATGGVRSLAGAGALLPRAGSE